MARPPAANAPATARDPARLPVITYGMCDPVRFRMNGETVELIPVRAAHTGGDTIVRFVNADVIMIGDFYRNFGYPFIDTANGGSLKGALEGLELTMKIAGPNTRLIPGHGTYINRTDIVPYRDMMLAVQARVQQLIAQGKTLPEVLAAIGACEGPFWATAVDLGRGRGGTAAGISSLFFNLCTGWIVTHFGYSIVLILAGLLAPIGALVLLLLVGDLRRIEIPINAND